MTIPEKTGGLALAAVLLGLSILALPVHDVRAQVCPGCVGGLGTTGTYILQNGASTPDCADIGGFWTNSTFTCTIDGRGELITGDSLSIDPGATLVIGKGANLENFAYVDNNGTVVNEGVIKNGGTFINSGILNNTGTFDNGTPGVVLNQATIINSGYFTNAYVIYNQVGGTITGYSITESSKGSIGNNGTISTHPGAPPAPPASQSAIVAVGAVLVLAVLGTTVYFLRSRGIIFAARRLPASPVSMPAVQTVGVQWINVKTGEKVPAVRKLLPPEGATLDKADSTRASNETTGDLYSLDSEDKVWINIRTGSKTPAVEGYAPPEGARLDKADANSALAPTTGARYVIHDPAQYAHFTEGGS